MKRTSFRRPRALPLLLVLALLVLGLLLRRREEEGSELKDILAAVLVMKTTVDTERHPTRVQTILDTWAQPALLRRHGLAVFFVTCQVPGERMLCPPSELGGFKTREMMWAMREIMEMHPQVRYVVKVDDVTYIIPANLERLLSGTPIDYAGNVLRVPPQGITFASGGAGVVLGRSQVQTCLARHDSMEKEYIRKVPQYLTGEDLALALCQSPLLPQDLTGSARKEQVFNAFGPVRTLLGEVDSWYISYKRAAKQESEFQPPNGLAAISPDVVSFHYVDHALSRFLHRLLYTNQLSTAQKVLEEFPRSGVGGYEKKINTLQQAELLLGMARLLNVDTV